MIVADWPPMKPVEFTYRLVNIRAPLVAGRAELRSGRSVARLARLLGVQEVAGSNPAAPTILISIDSPTVTQV